MCTITNIQHGSTALYYPHLTPAGMNFCIVSDAGQVSLVLYENADDTEPCSTIAMFGTEAKDLYATKWSVCIRVPEPEKGLFYNYLVNGQLILDPCAIETTDDLRYSGSTPMLPKCVARPIKQRQIRRPSIQYKNCVVQEINLYAYSKSGFNGFVEKLAHVKSFCNTASFTPIVQGDPNDCNTVNPATSKSNKEAWFYNPLLYFAPSANLASKRSLAMDECMNAIDKSHENGIEVVIDQVYNHTREGNNLGPVLHFKALGAHRYYAMENGNFTEYHTGCGNELNVHDPMVVDFIIANLRFWYRVMGVDGVRFDLFAVLGQNPRLVERILTDPELRGLKIYPEPWALGGLYMLGHCGLGTAEWNDKFRNTVREWVKGEFGRASDFASCTANWEGIFHKYQNHWSVNFVTCHDGFTLEDLVSWNFKNNWANGEGNRDGRDDNRSWNCGPDDRYNGVLDPKAPGLTADQIAHILSLPEDERKRVMAFRKQQKRNFMVILYLSQGIPFGLYGDEIGRTQGGNNNAYCQPQLSRMPWENLDEQEHRDELAFMQNLYSLRCEVTPNDCNIRRHGTSAYVVDMSGGARFSALEYIPEDGNKCHLYWASNAHDQELDVTLPEPPAGTQWYEVLSTQAGYDLAVRGAEPVSLQTTVAASSNRVLISM